MTTRTSTLRGRKAVYARKCDTLAPFEWLGKCSRMGGIEQPMGEKTITYRHSDVVGKFEPDQEFTGAPGATTTSLMMKETIKSRLYGDLMKCSWDFDVRTQSCGRVDDPFNWDMIKRLCCAELTSVSTDDESAYSSEDEGETIITGALSSRSPFIMIYPVIGQRVENYDLSDYQLTRIQVATTGHCADDCGPEEQCTLYAAVTADTPGNPPYFAKSIDGGMTWVLSPITAFGSGTSIDDIACLGDLVIAVSSTEPGYAYSWDGGVTWALVNDADNVEFLVSAPRRVAIRSRSLVLFGGEGGYLWKSTDGGVTATLVDEGIVTTGNVNDIQWLTDEIVFVVGDDNTMKKSSNGGDTWLSITLPAAKSADDVATILALSENLILIGYGTTGGLYYTIDGGITWAADASIASTTTINGLSHCECGVIYAVGASAGAGKLYRNVDGGAPARWLALTVDDAGVGYNDVACCDANNAVAVGLPTGIYTAGLVTKVG